MVTCKKIEIITVAKVGSTSLKNALEKKFKVLHRHSTEHLAQVLNDSNVFIICGIRNPLDRNISYFFQTYHQNFNNDVKCSSNNYKGENGFICKKKEIENMDQREIIKNFFSKKHHLTFNNWFNDFFKLTQINKLSFDKNRGLQFYDLKNKNKLLLYTLEKLDDNKTFLCNFFGIDKIDDANVGDDKEYQKIYKKFKENIRFSDYYKRRLLYTDIMHFFYNDADIESFYNKYQTYIPSVPVPINTKLDYNKKEDEIKQEIISKNDNSNEYSNKEIKSIKEVKKDLNKEIKSTEDVKKEIKNVYDESQKLKNDNKAIKKISDHLEKINTKKNSLKYSKRDQKNEKINYKIKEKIEEILKEQIPTTINYIDV